LTSKFLVRNLIIKSDQLRKDVILTVVLEKTAVKCLLHILHAGWLHSNYSRCLERLRDEGNLYRYLRPGFEEVNFLQLGVKTPVRKKILSGG